jgi:enolase
MPRMSDVKGRVVFNSRGEETIEVVVNVDGASGRYASPSGLSRGSLEVPPYPRGGVGEALKVLRDYIRPRLVGQSFDSQEEFDKYLAEIDGTADYSRIGGVLSLGLSIAFAEAAAKSIGIPLYCWLGGDDTNYLPVPLANIVGGGKHARGRSIDIQEVLVFPLNPPSIREAVKALFYIHSEAGKELSKKDRHFTGGKNDEGAWVTSLREEEVLEIMWEVIDRVRETFNMRFALGVDIAATSLWDEDLKLYTYSRSRVLRNREEQISYVISLVQDYNLSYVEDPLHEEDFTGFREITKSVRNTLIVGDDLYVTNKSRLTIGIEEEAGNGVVIKPNQAGDLTRSREAVNTAKRGGFKIIVSHRSGETEYPHLAPIAVAFKAELIKCGLVGGERVVKLNSLIAIEDELGGRIKPATLTL